MHFPVHERHFPLRAAFSKLIGVATIGLIFAGSVVTSKNVGLSVPDWPTSYGYQMWALPFSMWKGGVLYEHLHRVFASLAGLLVLIMAVWLLVKEDRPRLRNLGLACLGVVILQGLLGGATVLLTLPRPVSIAHGVLAQIFFCLTLVLAYGLSLERIERLQRPESFVSRSWRRGLVALCLLVGLQLVLAAWMRHDFKQQGGVAIPDFPTVAGRWVPWVNADSTAWVNHWREGAVWRHGANFELSKPAQTYQLAIHLAHRAVAAVIVGAFVVLTLAARRRYPPGHRVRRMVILANTLLTLQVILGLFTVWSNKGEMITSLHVMTGAALFGSTILLALRVLPPEWAPIVPRARDRVAT